MTGPVPSDRRAATARDLRTLRARRLVRRLLLGVGLPTLLAAVYYGAVITPQYESVSSFTVQTADGPAAPQLELLFASVPGNGGRDARLVQEHVQSRDMLRHLVEEHGFLAHYQDGEIDVFSRLPADAASETLYDYYRDKVTVDFDSASGILTLTVRAFDAENAERFSRAILAKSEAMVNRLAERARSDQTALARRELERAEERLAAARQAVAEAQGDQTELDPTRSAAALYELRARIEGELASARAELSALSATMPRTDPQVVAQRRRVAVLERQLEEQAERLAGEDAASVRAAIARFEPLAAEKEFAERAYASALASLEVARVEAARQHRYLATISGPSRSDEPSHPDVLWSILTALVLSFAGLGIGTLLIASVREHANV